MATLADRSWHYVGELIGAAGSISPELVEAYKYREDDFLRGMAGNSLALATVVVGKLVAESRVELDTPGALEIERTQRVRLKRK